MPGVQRGQKKRRETQLFNEPTFGYAGWPPIQWGLPRVFGVLLTDCSPFLEPTKAGDIRSNYLGLPVAYTLRINRYPVQRFFAGGKIKLQGACFFETGAYNKSL